MMYLMPMTHMQVGRLSPQFADASLIAAMITQAGFSYDIGEIYYNKYISAVKYELTVVPVFTKDRIEVSQQSALI